MVKSLKLIFVNNSGVVIFLGIFILFGGFLRFYQLGEQSLWIDEGYTINASQGILDHGYPLLDSGATYNAHAFHNYIVAGSIGLFGFDPYNPWSARVPAALFGILSILAIFLFTKSITKNSLVALASSFLMTFSYWEIAWSRQARGYVDMQFFILLAFTFFYKWLETRKIKDGLLTILFLVLSYLSHGIALIFVPSFFVIFLIHSIWSGKIKEMLSPITMVFFAILGIISVWIILKILPPITTYAYSDEYASFLINGFKYVSILSLTIIGGLVLWKKIFWQIMYIIGIILPTTIIIVFYSQVIQMRYLLPVFPFLLVAGTYGTYLLVVKKKYMPSIYRLLLYIIIIGGLSFSMTTFIPRSTYNLERGSPQPDFKKGYEIIQRLKTDDDVVISPYTQLTKIYLRDRGLWLPVSLTGHTSEIVAHTINGGDYYTGAPIIPTGEALMNIFNTQSGYIILDGMARSRLKELFTTIIENQNVVPVYYGTSSSNDAIAVYIFGMKSNDNPN